MNTTTNRLRHLLILSLIVAGAGLPAGHAAAQAGTPPAATPPAATTPGDVPIVQQLRIQVMPEYDDPRVLVILQGRFVTTGTTFPAEVTFRLPRVADINEMAVMDLTSGSITPQQYVTATDPLGDEWMLVTYTLDNPHFFYEYYYSPYETTDGNKQFTYTFNSVHPISDLVVDIQQPLKATDFSATPPPDDVQQDDGWGFFHHLYNAGVVAPDTDAIWQVRYTKTDPAPSLTREQVQAGPGGTTTTPAAPAATELPTWVLPLAGGILLLIIAGVLALRSRRPPERVTRRGPRPARRGTTPAPARPPQLSRSERAAQRAAPPRPAAEDGERPRFCNRCGARLSEDALFCQRCGKPIGGAPAGQGAAAAPLEDEADDYEEYEEEEGDEPETGQRATLLSGSPRLIVAGAAVVLAGVLIWSATLGPARPSAGPAAVPTAPLDQAQMVAGAEVFLANCATCHGQRAEGGQGPALNSSGTAYLRGDSELRGIIAQGRGAMPAWGDKLSAAEIDAVIYFLKRQWTPDQRAQQAGTGP